MRTEFLRAYLGDEDVGTAPFSFRPEKGFDRLSKEINSWWFDTEEGNLFLDEAEKKLQEKTTSLRMNLAYKMCI